MISTVSLRRLARFAPIGAAFVLLACGGDGGEEGAGETAGAPRIEVAPLVERLDHGQLTEDLVILSADDMAGRAVGTPGGEKARAYIAGRFQEIGLRPVGGDSFVHPFIAAAPGTERGFAEAANVLGLVPGSAPGVIVVTAHYDHLGEKDGEIYNGADDNASGVATLLAMAADFMETPPRHPIVFAALDAEEVGQRGAEDFVQSPPPPIRMSGVILNVNLDMVSRSQKRELYAAGVYHYPYLRPYIEQTNAASPITVRMGHDQPEDGPNDWTEQSDHYAFHLRGVPFIYFGVEDHPDYHQSTDTSDKVRQAFFADSAETIVYAVRTFDENLEAILDASGR
ncbi:MAG: M28 family peptidase [Pseudomonadota bacterium]